jgi:hypothetical protein
MAKNWNGQLLMEIKRTEFEQNLWEGLWSIWEGQFLSVLGFNLKLTQVASNN